MEKKYLIIGDFGTVKLVPEIGKNDVVMRAQGKYDWLINLEKEEAFSPEKNQWLPLKDFPII